MLRVVVAIAAVPVAVVGVVLGDWWTLASVAGVLVGVFAWRPVWKRERYDTSDLP